MKQPIAVRKSSFPGRTVSGALLVVAAVTVSGVLLVCWCLATPQLSEQVTAAAGVASPLSSAWSAARARLWVLEPGVFEPAPGRTPLQVVVRYQGDVATLPSEARVYVFIRRTGERMPLGVERFTLIDLPARVEFSGLDPSQPLEVVARLSRLGNVSFDPGDIDVVASTAEAAPGAALELVLELD